MNQPPILTAIVPCKNHEKWVYGALKSITDQQYPVMRLVFIDDGSTDNSWQLSKIHARIYSNFK